MPTDRIKSSNFALNYFDCLVKLNRIQSALDLSKAVCQLEYSEDNLSMKYTMVNRYYAISKDDGFYLSLTDDVFQSDEYNQEIARALKNR